MVSPVEKTDTFEKWRQKFNQVVELLINGGGGGGGVAGVKTFNGRDGYVVPRVGDYTAAMVGLENVDNTSDADKPISIATQNALATKANDADLAAVAKTGDFSDLINVPTFTIPTASATTLGGIKIGSGLAIDENGVLRATGGGGGFAGVETFNGRDGVVTPQAGDYTAAMVGLDKVNNTSDADKPISTATQAALDLKANAADVTAALNDKVGKQYVDDAVSDKANAADVTAQIDALTTALNEKANASEVTEALNAKATTEYVDDSVAPKADTTYVDEELAKKANIGDIPSAISLSSLSDVSAPAPVEGQVLIFDENKWQPRALAAAGFPGLAALDWKNPLELGFTKGDLPILAANTGTFEIAKFQNQAFLRVMSVAVSGNITPGRWKTLFTNVPAAWLPEKGNALSVMQTWGASDGGSLVAICAGNNPSAIWMIPLVWNNGQNYLHGIVSWYC